MALTVRGDGTGTAFQVNSTWWNDYHDLLTGSMHDQPVTLNYRPGSGTTPTLLIKGDGSGKLIRGLKTDDTTEAFSIDSNGNAVFLGTVSAGGATAWTSANDGTGSGLDADKLDGLNSGNASGNIPISNGTLCTNLNADKLDGLDSTVFLQKSGGTMTGALTVNAGITSGNSSIPISKPITAADLSGQYYGVMRGKGATPGRAVWVVTGGTDPTAGDGLVEGDLVFTY